MSGNIILIGMPGSGKSTVGVLLAKAAGMRFSDTDLLIQQETGKKLQEIIDCGGLDFFLKTEENVIAAADFENSVVATGGSAVFGERAMKKLKSGGTTVFLDVPLEEIERRINNITTRGIAMRRGETLESVYNERLPLYKKYADMKSGNAEETVAEILKQIN